MKASAGMTTLETDRSELIFGRDSWKRLWESNVERIEQEWRSKLLNTRIRLVIKTVHNIVVVVGGE